VTDATLGASGLWLGTLTGAGATATLTDRVIETHLLVKRREEWT
jgi:hypothetical protein